MSCICLTNETYKGYSMYNVLIHKECFNQYYDNIKTLPVEFLKMRDYHLLCKSVSRNDIDKVNYIMNNLSEEEIDEVFLRIIPIGIGYHYNKLVEHLIDTWYFDEKYISRENYSVLTSSFEFGNSDISDYLITNFEIDENTLLKIDSLVSCCRTGNDENLKYLLILLGDKEDTIKQIVNCVSESSNYDQLEIVKYLWEYVNGREFRRLYFKVYNEINNKYHLYLSVVWCEIIFYYSRRGNLTVIDYFNHKKDVFFKNEQCRNYLDEFFPMVMEVCYQNERDGLISYLSETVFEV